MCTHSNHDAQGFKAARAHAETVLTLMEIVSFQSKFPCFVQCSPQKAINGFKARLLHGQALSDQQVARLVDGLVQCVLLVLVHACVDAWMRGCTHHNRRMHGWRSD